MYQPKYRYYNKENWQQNRYSQGYSRKYSKYNSEVSVIEYTKEDLAKENDLIQKIMVGKPSLTHYSVATYNCYFGELERMLSEAPMEQAGISEPEQIAGIISKSKAATDKISNDIHGVLRGLVPSKVLGEEVPALLQDCMKECDVPSTSFEDTKIEIRAQIDHYSTEFYKAKDALLSLIIKKETAEYEKSQKYNCDYGEEKVKFLSAYRIFRRTIAPSIKAERPNLNGKERQTIIRERWRQLEPKKKYIYVLRSRWDKERARFRQKTMEFKTQLALFCAQTEHGSSASTGSTKKSDIYSDGKTESESTIDFDITNFGFIKEEDEEDEDDDEKLL